MRHVCPRPVGDVSRTVFGWPGSAVLWMRRFLEITRASRLQCWGGGFSGRKKERGVLGGMSPSSWLLSVYISTFYHISKRFVFRRNTNFHCTVRCMTCALVCVKVDFVRWNITPHGTVSQISSCQSPESENKFCSSALLCLLSCNLSFIYSSIVGVFNMTQTYTHQENPANIKILPWWIYLCDRRRLAPRLDDMRALWSF